MYDERLAFLALMTKIVLNGYFVSFVDCETIRNKTYPVPDGYVEVPHLKIAYKIDTQSQSWLEARGKCFFDGAKLAIADSAEKIIHINNLRTKDSFGKLLHVGIYKRFTTGDWTSIDEELPINNMPWASNQPDGNGMCAGISSEENGLINYSCVRERKPSVCQVPIFENTGIHDYIIPS